MPELHISTALMIVGAMYLLLPSITWLVLALQRSTQVALWCGGGLMIGVASILAGMPAKLPGFLGVSLPVYLLLVANFARIQSLRLDLGVPLSGRTMLVALVSILAGFEFVHLGLQDAVWRIRFSASMNAALVFYLAALALRIGKAEQSRSALWISGVYSLVGISFLLRVVTVDASAAIVLMSSTDWSTRLLVLSALLSSVMGHVGYVGLALDRSMRRELQAAVDQARDEESRRLSAQIAHLDRQRSLGEMSAALAHEVKQPLMAILTNAQVAQRGVQSGNVDAARLGTFLDKIVHNTQRASQIIERVRNFIQPSDAQSQPLLLNHVLQEVVALVADEARHQGVNIQLPATLPDVWVNGDAVALSQVLLNVFQNAIQAMSESTRREITVACIVDPTHVKLRVMDSGPGLTTAAATQAGMPFFTTKPGGLGMGLCISQTITRQHHGTLTLRNTTAEIGGGAIAELTLPLLHQPKP